MLMFKTTLQLHWNQHRELVSLAPAGQAKLQIVVHYLSQHWRHLVPYVLSLTNAGDWSQPHCSSSFWAAVTEALWEWELTHTGTHLVLSVCLVSMDLGLSLWIKSACCYRTICLMLIVIFNYAQWIMHKVTCRIEFAPLVLWESFFINIAKVVLWVKYQIVLEISESNWLGT